MTTDDKMREIEAALESLIDRAAVGRGVADQRIKVRDLIRAAIAPQADAEHEAKVEAWRYQATECRLAREFGELSYEVTGEEIDEALSLMRARPTAARPSALERLRERVANMDAADRGYRVRSAVLEMIDEEMNNG